MKIDSLIKVGIFLAFASAATVQLPNIIWAVHKAQHTLVKESQASKWGIPPLLK
jgi:hypothetical protein